MLPIDEMRLETIKGKMSSFINRRNISPGITLTLKRLNRQIRKPGKVPIKNRKNGH